MAKVTEWFPVSTPPVRPGWYEFRRGYDGQVERKWFNSLLWLDKTPLRDDVEESTLLWIIHGDQWRGLTEPA